LTPHLSINTRPTTTAHWALVLVKLVLLVGV